MEKIILASASPRRRELLSLICNNFEITVSDVDESKIKSDSPEELTILLAKAKCIAVENLKSGCVVIGCDTIVELNSEILGKPTNKEHARQMISSLSGKEHSVHTGVFIKHKEVELAFAVTTIVEFAPMTNEEIENYISTTDPYDKAGGYGIQSGAARFVKNINGCYYNVMGFPVQRVYKALLGMGVL